MSPAVLDLADRLAQEHHLTVRDVLARIRKAGLQFRTETNRVFTDAAQEENVMLGFSYEGFYYPYDDENQELLTKLVLEVRPRELTAAPG